MILLLAVLLLILLIVSGLIDYLASLALQLFMKFFWVGIIYEEIMTKEDKLDMLVDALITEIYANSDLEKSPEEIIRFSVTKVIASTKKQGFGTILKEHVLFEVEEDMALPLMSFGEIDDNED